MSATLANERLELDRRGRDAALSAIGGLTTSDSDAVEYQSSGHLLIVGDAARVAAVVPRMDKQRRCTVLVSDGAADVSWPSHVQRLAHTLTRLEGYLGRFSAYVLDSESGAEIELAPLVGCAHFDVVLDLGAKPTLPADLPPPGYLAPSDADGLDAALEQARDLVGVFEKPRYVRVNSDLCAHSASGLLGCTRCLDVCPAWAIHPQGEKVGVDVHLCHGVGSCASACPTGAISYNLPDRRMLLDRVRTLLQAFHAAGGEGAALLVHDSTDAQRVNESLETLPGRVLPLQMEEIGAAGMELWLSALAYGAIEVLLLVGDRTPPSVLRVLDGEIDVVRGLLAGMSDARSVRRVGWEALARLPASTAAARCPVARYAPLEDKREAIHMALDHLSQPHTPRPGAASLPQGAAFGAVSVAAGCTLCMACVSVCPPGALQGGTESPQLKFLEHNCVQCGLCVKACPEKVVTLQPRYLFDGELRRTARTLCEDEAVCCLDCGKPFAPRASIAKLQQQLAGHRMFAGAAARRFELCDACRVKDILRATGQG